MNEKLRQEIAGFFLQDSGDYLARFGMLFNENGFTHIGTRSKLLVDILFSIECSLKALIFIESQDDEKDTYDRIRKCSHNIDKLLRKIKSVDNDFVKFKTFAEQIGLDKYSICSRYSLEANICFRENGVLGTKYYSTIANPNWIETLYNEANKLKEYVGSKIASFVVVNFSDINIDELLGNQKRISEITKK